jgi:hypothetical protein
MKCDSLNCLSPEEVILKSSASVMYLSSAILGSDNNVSAFFTINDNVLKMVHCKDSMCTDVQSNDSIVAGIYAPSEYGISRGADGLPLVSYVITSSGVGELLHCANDICSSISYTGVHNH